MKENSRDKSKTAGRLLFAPIAAAVIICALFALGVFDGPGAQVLSKKEYAGRSFAYTGQLLDGKFDGYCEILFSDGSTYTGYVAGGRFEGEGEFESADGWRFAGTFDYGLPDGGTFFLSDGREVTYGQEDYTDVFTTELWSYTGLLGESGQSGYGDFVFADGAAYAGEFSLGLADGYGVYTDPEGRVVYFGDFSVGFYDGQGVYISEDGWYYEGGFAKGLFDGAGEITDGTKKVSGVWSKGVQIK
ncbi:MAG: hypothetical protein FWG48_03470 [Oscillospiraceae bacterium]|nr:hypothetical protein [Oscillospiraceae bacterium]